MEENNPVQPQQPIVEPQPVKKPLFSKTIIAIFVIILILILLPAGAYLFLNSNKQVACTTEAKICPDGSSVGRTGPKCEFTACPTTKPTSTPDPTASWKTYNASYDNYSVKYPADLKILEDEYNGKKFRTFIQNSNFQIVIYPNGLTGKSTLEAYRINLTTINANNFSQITVANETGYKYQILQKDENSIGVIFMHNGKLYQITASPSNSKDIFYLDQILSTFKFTDQTSQTANNPTKVVNDFYSAYVDCQQDRNNALLKGTSLPTCPSYTTSTALSSDLISKLNQVRGADPILCAQNIPASIKIDNAIISGNTANAIVHTYYVSSGDNPIQIGLTLENNNWVITSIACANGAK